jgi:predicted nuclease of restriction endonuclease-like (RecB) superfamily
MAKRKKSTALRKTSERKPATVPDPEQLLHDIRELIAAAREQVARTVNAGLVHLYWQIGNRIQRDILGEERAEYGQQIVAALSRQLTTEFGKGFTRANLFRMMQFAGRFPDATIVAVLTRQLSWTHFVILIPIDDQLKRDSYAEMCRIERWSTRTLERKIAGRLYERTALAKKPEAVIQRDLQLLRDEDRLTPDLVFRDPYFLDFLGLADTYSEKDLEAAILRELEKFLLELGGDFAFLDRQKRITVDGDDFYLDLLFYHRRLHRLVAIDLKLDKFTPADKGQMEFYLRWLAKHEQQAGEDSPIGLILCASKSSRQIELLELEKSGIRVAEYLTELPSRELLDQKLLQAIRIARAQLATRNGVEGN